MNTSITLAPSTSATVAETRFRYTERTVDRSKFQGQICASLYSPVAAYRSGDTPWAALKAIDFDFFMDGLTIEVLIYSSGNRITTEQPHTSNDPLYRREGEQIKVWLHRVLDRVNGIEVIIPGKFFTPDQVIALHNNLRPSKAGVQPDRTRHHIATLKGESVPGSPRELILKNERKAEVPAIDLGVRSDWSLKSKRPDGSPSRPIPILKRELPNSTEVAHPESLNPGSVVKGEPQVAYEIIEVAHPEPPAPIATPFSVTLELATIAPDYRTLKALYKDRFKVSAPNIKEAHLRAIVVARILSGV